MAKLRLTNIRICAWFFFMLVVFGPVCLGAGFVSQLGSDGFRDRIFTSITAQISTPAAEEFDMAPVVMLLKAVQLPLVAILLLILGGSVLALFLFIRYFVTPMDKMAVIARRITEGNLGEVVPICSCNEISQLGESYNDLSINLQEIILLVWNLTRDSSALLDQMIEKDADHSDDGIFMPIRQDLVSIREQFQAMEDVILSFDLYDVHIEGERIVATTDPWREPG
jgi:methyl-accepting chemotaxis protein